MKAFRYICVLVVLISGLMSDAYASAPSYIKSYSFMVQSNIYYDFFKAIFYIIMFALILAAAYYTTKYLAKNGMAQGKTRTMKLIESMPLGADRSLHIVKVGAQFFLIGSAAKNMFLISELEEDKLLLNLDENLFNLNGVEIESYEDSIEAKDFGTYLDSVKQNLHKLKSMVRGKKDNE